MTEFNLSFTQLRRMEFYRITVKCDIQIIKSLNDPENIWFKLKSKYYLSFSMDRIDNRLFRFNYIMV